MSSAASTGVLSDQEVIDESERYDTRLVLTWADRLRRLPGIPLWIDQNYRLSQVFGTRSVKVPRGAKDRSIYLRRDADFASAVHFWATPRKECLDGSGDDCVPFSEWIKAWTEIKG